MAEERECLEREVRRWLRRDNIWKGKEVDEERECLERERRWLRKENVSKEK